MIQIIVLEDTKEYISYAPKEEVLAQERRPFDLLVRASPMELFFFFFIIFYNLHYNRSNFCSNSVTLL